MTSFTPVSASIGGVLIGLAAVLLLKFNGRIAGISGVLNGAIEQRGPERTWRLLFLLGLLAGGALGPVLTGTALITRSGFSLPLLVLAGLLVGAGTRIGSGCTSGHGVCGLARLSPRSLVATLVFLATGMATATAMHALG